VRSLPVARAEVGGLALPTVGTTGTTAPLPGLP